MSKRLSEISSGGHATVQSIEGGLNVRQRLCELGVYPGESILVEKTGILGGPLMLKVGDHHIALGKGLAQKILVE